MPQYILSIDQGTSSTKTIIFNEKGKLIAEGSALLKTKYFKNGFVEQDPYEILDNVKQSIKNCIVDFNVKGLRIDEIKCIGISNQRETLVVWDKAGKPLNNAVVWQCKRSVDICNRLKSEGLNELVNQRTGLLIDPYFSATKLMWLKENVVDIKDALVNGELYFGTIDTWLIYHLTNQQVYATDYTNASRTLFFNLNTLSWDKELLEIYDLSNLHLPEIRFSTADYGKTTCFDIFQHEIAITGAIGDSHAAAFGEGCYNKGYAKATLGTGCSIMMNIGEVPQYSKNGMVTTICWSANGKIDYAYEGVIVSCGATIEWVKNNLQLFKESSETETLALEVESADTVYVIPAFSGMGAPYWKMDALASIIGLNFGSTKAHIVRAALETIPFQINDIFNAIKSDSGIQLEKLMVDGGITHNNFVIKSIADLLTQPVVRIGVTNVSALGAAYIAGLHAGIYTDFKQLEGLQTNNKTINPTNNFDIVKRYRGWQNVTDKYL
ncbi:FGGY family carbohydrate kinase [Polluticaenibacter yanchengensis]|uniref:ATP:glycerol 3-phosphotransferase n=1 Tax=Polluticaenibacter yanchengensis TaxID=3014562 RepID=A0ABT4UHQ3_9BACT|nr:glycerol kinase GlpK [Chitinophagaceae bacterium LY-5]